MRKSLSLLLAIAMVFSMFSSLAFAADSDLTAQQKYDALADKGIFAGINGEAALDQNMNRAQFARVASLILGLEDISATDTSIVTEKPFSDVELGLWYTDEIAAAKEAGVFVGNADGTFNPKGDITVQELAVVAAGLLGLTPVEGAEVEGAADWAAGYIKAIQDAGIDFPTNYTEPATRADLASLAFTADAALNPAETAVQTVTSVTATGAKKVTVVFGKAVADAKDVKFTVKKGAANVSVADTDAYAWSTDKKTVVITLDAKFTEGTYTVTAESTIEGESIVNASNDVTVTNETIKSIEILSASETIAKYDYNIIRFEAVNQYGEVSDRPASNFDVISGNTNAGVTKDPEKQEVTFDTDHPTLLPKDTRVALTVVAPDATATATKIFIIGDTPSASKIEIGELKLEDGKERLTAGENAVLELSVFDQYGNKIGRETEITNSTTLISTNGGVISNTRGVGLVINTDGNLDINTITGSVTKDTDVVITLIANGSGSSVSHTVNVSAPRTPTEVSFGAFTDTVAEGDGTVYLPLVVTDQFGEKLSNKDIAEKVSSFSLYSNNTSVLTSAGIHTTTDEHYGKVAVGVGLKGNASVTVMITSNGKTNAFPISVQEARVPTKIVIDNTPVDKLLPGAAAEFKFKIKDQYGKNIEDTFDGTSKYTVDFTVTRKSGDPGTLVSETLTGTSGTGDIYADVSNNGTAFTVTHNLEKYGVVTVSAKLIKEVDGGIAESTLSTVNKDVETIKASVADDLTYEVAQLGSIYDASGLPTSPDYQAKLAKEVTVKAKDAAGKAVGLPSSVVNSVYSSNEIVAEPDGNFVYGLDKGTVTLTVSFSPVAGNTKIVTQEVTVSDVIPTADTLTAKNTSKAIAVSDLDTISVWDDALAGELVLKDSYGIEYKNNDTLTELNDYTDVTKIRYSISNAVWDGTAGTLNVHPTTGVITHSGSNLESFKLQIYSATNGKMVTVEVSVF